VSGTLSIARRIERMKGVLTRARATCGQSIANRRTALGLSRRGLAKRAGVDYGLLYRMEHGREWAPPNIRRVDAVLTELESRRQQAKSVTKERAA